MEVSLEGRRVLADILVVSLEQAVAAPLASVRLADSGARVIKLERREGDFARGYDAYVLGDSSYFVWLNHGKQSVYFDLKDRRDIAFLHRILACADVFIQNLAPGGTERAGIGSSSLRERYPRLITCDISGYGSDGPYRDMKAYDLLVQAESGLAYLSGTPDEPGRVGVSVCDIACGMSAYQGILQALYVRERTGRGQGIEVSLYHSISDWMNVPYLQYRYGHHEPSRPGLHHPTIAPYGVYTCGDGKAILLSIQNEREWERFSAIVLGDATLAGRDEFHSNNKRVQYRRQLDELISVTLGSLVREEVIERLALAEIAYGKLSTLDDLVHHPQNRFVTVETHGERVELLAPPGVSGHETASFGHIPTVGEHDASIREEFPAVQA